jgi:hypothetical protein
MVVCARRLGIVAVQVDDRKERCPCGVYEATRVIVDVDGQGERDLRAVR